MLGQRVGRIPAYLLITVMPLIFWFSCRGYPGPVILADEIGYLAKAAFVAGQSVDGAFSYYLGYALFLAPVFTFFHSPSAVWLGVMVINCLFWFGSFLLLNQFLTLWKPDISEFDRFCALLISVVYPMWMTSAHYAFATNAIVFIFLCCIITLAKWRQTDTLSLIPHSLCIGFLCWTHPTALGVALASIITVAVISRAHGNYRGLVMHSFLVIFLILVYQKGLHPWINKEMTPAGYASFDHYPSILLIFKKISHFSVWPELTTLLWGQLSYMIISSFGLTLFGLMMCFQRIKTIGRAQIISLFLLMSLFFVMFIGASLFISIGVSKPNHWIYGRYVDCVIVPLLGIGFLALRQWNKKIRWVGILVAIALTLPSAIAIEKLFVPGAPIIPIHTASFWPQYLINEVSFSKWMWIGSAGIIIVGILGEYVAVLLMVGSFFLALPAEASWHKTRFAYAATPTSVVDIIRRNFAPGSCVGFDDNLSPELLGPQQLLKFQFYLFYFYDYVYRRISVDQWRLHCNGPLLTYNPQPFINSKTEHIIAREKASSLFLVVKNSQNLDISADNRARSDVWYANDPAFLSSAFVVQADELAEFTQVGLVRHHQLLTTGKAGYLFYGPYRKLEAGAYAIILRGDFWAASTAIVDVVSNGGTQIYYAGKPCQDQCRSGQLVIPFELKKKTSALEIRLRVGNADRVAISGYEIINQRNLKI